MKSKQLPLQCFYNALTKIFTAVGIHFRRKGLIFPSIVAQSYLCRNSVNIKNGETVG